MSVFWRQCLSHFRGVYGSEIFDAFIAPVQCRENGDRIFLTSPNEASSRWLAANLADPVSQLAGKFFSDAVTIKYQTGGLPAVVASSPAAPEAATVAVAPIHHKTRLRHDLTFDNLVRGKANESGFWAAEMIAAGDKQINPLLFYGSTGLGKTHLAQAIGNQYLAKNPRKKVLYLTARDFMSEFINACRHNQNNQFSLRYDGLDMLIVDDIQYIGGDKARTQEEFFYIFNKLYDEQKNLIITSDRAPGEVRDLPARLRSRLSCGLPVHITPPEFELREAIIHKKALQQGVTLDKTVSHFIAEKIKSNVRELEGALKRVLASAAFCACEPTLELCRRALADLLGPANRTINPDLILQKVAEFYHLHLSDLSSKKRARSIVQPRHIAAYLCRQMTNMSLPEIGGYLGNRNHTTVLHSCKKIESQLQNDLHLAEQVKILEMLIKS